jgi:hypothetical protein
VDPLALATSRSAPIAGCPWAKTIKMPLDNCYLGSDFLGQYCFCCFVQFPKFVD